MVFVVFVVADGERNKICGQIRHKWAQLDSKKEGFHPPWKFQVGHSMRNEYQAINQMFRRALDAKFVVLGHPYRPQQFFR